MQRGGKGDFLDVWLEQRESWLWLRQRAGQAAKMSPGSRAGQARPAPFPLLALAVANRLLLSPLAAVIE